MDPNQLPKQHHHRLLKAVVAATAIGITVSPVAVAYSQKSIHYAQTGDLDYNAKFQRDVMEPYGEWLIGHHFADAVASGDQKPNCVDFGLNNKCVQGGDKSTTSPSPSAPAPTKNSASPSPKPAETATPTQTPTPSVTPTSPSPSPSPSRTETNPINCLQDMTPEEKLGQMQVVGIPAGSAAELARLMRADASIYDRYHIGGIILMKGVGGQTIKNFQNQQHIRTLVSVDVEGGDIDRYANMFGRLPTQAETGKNWIGGQISALDKIRKRGIKLKSIGVDQVLGPVADVDHKDIGNALEKDGRLFSDDPERVKNLTVAEDLAWNSVGIISTNKHFPAGTGPNNTDFGPSQTVDASNPANLEPDLAPYRAQPPGSAIMVSNAIVPGLTNGQPASLSQEAVTGLLRNKLNFGGLVLTDDLGAGAIKGSIADAAVRSIQAGVDEPLWIAKPGQPFEQQVARVSQRLLEAYHNHEITDSQLNASVARVMVAKRVNPCDIKR
jgi:beta-N-acetylhexosaminidase